MIGIAKEIFDLFKSNIIFADYEKGYKDIFNGEIYNDRRILPRTKYDYYNTLFNSASTYETSLNIRNYYKEEEDPRLLIIYYLLQGFNKTNSEILLDVLYKHSNFMNVLSYESIQKRTWKEMVNSFESYNEKLLDEIKCLSPTTTFIERNVLNFS